MDPTQPASPPPPVSGAGIPPEDGTWVSGGYRSSWLRARFVVGLLALAIAALAISALVDIDGLGLLGAAAAGNLDQQTASAFDDLRQAVGFLVLTFVLGSAISVLAWLSRVVDNVPPLAGSTPRRSPREAIGWWFVPVANVVVPFQIVSDAVQRLRSGADEGAERLIQPWWGLFLLATAIAYLGWQLPADSADDGRMSFAVSITGALVQIASGVLLLLIVRSVERRSNRLARALRAATSTPRAS